MGTLNMNVETREPRDEQYEIVSLCREHLTEAAALFVAGYREARERQPSLPAAHENARAILPRLRDLAAKEPGVAALRDGRIAGFLLGQVLPTFRGNRSVYVPEWCMRPWDSSGRTSTAACMPGFRLAGSLMDASRI